MMNKEKIKMLEIRLQQLESNEKANQGVCRKIRREIRKLKNQKK